VRETQLERICDLRESERVFCFISSFFVYKSEMHRDQCTGLHLDRVYPPAGEMHRDQCTGLHLDRVYPPAEQ